MSLESAKSLGFISSLISVIMPVVTVVAFASLILSLIMSIPFGSSTAVPNAGLFSAGLVIFLIAVVVVDIVGFILFMLAMYRLSHYYNEPGIFNNVLYAFIISIVGGIVALGIFFAFILSTIGSISRTSTPSTITPIFSQIIITYLIVIGVALLFGIINGVLYMRAFNKLGKKSGVDSFKTAGLLYFLGVLLSIVGIGGILTWIAWIFAAIGFKKLKPAPIPTSGYSTPQSTAPNMTQTKRCPYCGTENLTEAIYCKNCGKPLQ